MGTSNFDIASDDGNVNATVYYAGELVAKPTIILCHGFCGIQEVLLPNFAEAFSAAGFNAVTFDYRGFGRSAGERGRLIPASQIADIGFMVRWAAAQPFVERQRIGLWGTSLGGAHVIEAAARSDLVKCVVSQLAFADGRSLITAGMTEEAVVSLFDTLEKMYERKLSGGKEVFVPISKVLTDPDSKDFLEKIRVDYPQANIKIPLLTVRETINYSPVDCAPRVSQPTLVMAAEHDIVNPPSQARRLYDALSAKKAWHLEVGARHYDFYHSPHFEREIGEQIGWFEHLRS
jgi:dipeptidyl aminopeptidase/acylaminoacyl peptidase